MKHRARAEKDDRYEKEFRRQQAASKAREHLLHQQLDLRQLGRRHRSVSERARDNASLTMSRGTQRDRSVSREAEKIPERKRQRSPHVSEDWRARVEGRSVLQKIGSALKIGVKDILGAVGMRARTPRPSRDKSPKRARKHTMEEIREQIHTPHGHIDPKKYKKFVDKHILPEQGFRPPHVGSLRDRGLMPAEEVERQFVGDRSRRHTTLNKTWRKNIREMIDGGDLSREDGDEQIRKQHPQIRSELASERDKESRTDAHT